MFLTRLIFSESRKPSEKRNLSLLLILIQKPNVTSSGRGFVFGVLPWRFNSVSRKPPSHARLVSTPKHLQGSVHLSAVIKKPPQFLSSKSNSKKLKQLKAKWSYSVHQTLLGIWLITSLGIVFDPFFFLKKLSIWEPASLPRPAAAARPLSGSRKRDIVSWCPGVGVRFFKASRGPSPQYIAELSFQILGIPQILRPDASEFPSTETSGKGRLR